MSTKRQAVTRLTLDMSLDAVQKSVAISKGDTNRRMEITLTDAGRPFTLPASWTATLAGGTVEDGCVVDRGRIIYDLSSGVLTAEAGIFELAFRIFDEEGDEMATPMITCNVYDVERNTAAVASTEEFSVLAEFVENINEVEERLDAAEDSTKDVAGRMESAEGRLDDTETRLDDTESWQQEADGRLDSLDVWLDDLEAEVKGLDDWCTELEDQLTELDLRVNMTSLTIDPSQWSDGDPYVAFSSVYVGQTTGMTATILLVPLTPETRAEARKTELSVDYAYNSSSILSIWLTRTEYVPTVTMYFTAVVVTSHNSVPGGFTGVAASFVGVTELPDVLMDKEVLQVLTNHKYTDEDRVTELINESLGVIENGTY